MHRAFVVAVDGRLPDPANDGALAGSEVIRGRCVAGSNPVGEEVEAGARVLLDEPRERGARRSRFESKSFSQGFSRPRIESAIIIAAAVPFVMPHLLNPVAV